MTKREMANALRSSHLSINVDGHQLSLGELAAATLEREAEREEQERKKVTLAEMAVACDQNRCASCDDLLVLHELKIATTHFDAWLRGEKTFELRRDDREPKFAAGDELRLREVVRDEAFDQRGLPIIPVWSDTGRQIVVRVRSVLRDFEGLLPGYAILSCTLVENLTPAGSAP